MEQQKLVGRKPPVQTILQVISRDLQSDQLRFVCGGRHLVPSNEFVESSSAVMPRLIVKCGVPQFEEGEVV